MELREISRQGVNTAMNNLRIDAEGSEPQSRISIAFDTTMPKNGEPPAMSKNTA